MLFLCVIAQKRNIIYILYLCSGVLRDLDFTNGGRNSVCNVRFCTMYV